MCCPSYRGVRRFRSSGPFFREPVRGLFGTGTRTGYGHIGRRFQCRTGPDRIHFTPASSFLWDSARNATSLCGGICVCGQSDRFPQLGHGEDSSTEAEMVDSLSRLHPQSRDRIIRLVLAMGGAVPYARVRPRGQSGTQGGGLQLPIPTVTPTTLTPPPSLAQCPTPECLNQCGRPVYGRGHRNHFCVTCHRLHESWLKCANLLSALKKMVRFL